MGLATRPGKSIKLRNLKGTWDWVFHFFFLFIIDEVLSTDLPRPDFGEEQSLSSTLRSLVVLFWNPKSVFQLPIFKPNSIVVEALYWLSSKSVFRLKASGRDSENRREARLAKRMISMNPVPLSSCKLQRHRQRRFKWDRFDGDAEEQQKRVKPMVLWANPSLTDRSFPED